MKLLEDRIAFVTGGASGIGHAAALAFMRQGAWVAIADNNSEAARQVTSELESAGGKAMAITLDVTDADAVNMAVDQVVGEWGGIDCAFNNAGIALEDTTTPWGDHAIYDRVVSINQRGVLNCMTAELKHMAAAGKGAIVNTASIAGVAGTPTAAYCASKHAVVGLTRSAALQYAAAGIRINAVCPGAIETPLLAESMKDPESARIISSMHPMNRLGQPHEVADAVIFLCSEWASFVTGHMLAVDGGYLAR
ncbi:SDR family NAD(P)-dependent oxidoreductase [Croceicoccus estronivorus]|uniref:SDR family NAD(P)-dependent oxidoreductase n=1 Tax=Croceicoccus estronivorus TaxID=1172626 RepID=UPI000A91B3C6|nr:glucose 1-dehydrogenase [Croceicoccus estronivorus]